MNATRVSNRAGRKSGMLLNLILLALAINSARASEIVVTVTGTFRSGENHGIFGPDLALAQKPFTLVFRFDDSKGQPVVSQCRGNGTGIGGNMPSSPATATITINGISYEFGKTESAHSSAWRSIASRCSASQLRFEVDEGTNWYTRSGVNATIDPTPGTSLAEDPDWRGELSTTAMDTWSTWSSFVINGEGGKAATGAFNYKSVTISKSK